MSTDGLMDGRTDGRTHGHTSRPAISSRGLWPGELKMSQPIRVHGGYFGFPIATKSNNTSVEPLEEHLWQVWCQCMQWFLRRSRKCLSQSESRRPPWIRGGIAKHTFYLLGPKELPNQIWCKLDMLVSEKIFKVSK